MGWRALLAGAALIPAQLKCAPQPAAVRAERADTRTCPPGSRDPGFESRRPDFLAVLGSEVVPVEAVLKGSELLGESRNPVIRGWARVRILAQLRDSLAHRRTP